MPYDERLAERVRKALRRRRGIAERKMFGGICFLINGNMACGVLDKELMLASRQARRRRGLEASAHARDGFHRQAPQEHGLRETRRLEIEGRAGEVGQAGGRLRTLAAAEVDAEDSSS